MSATGSATTLRRSSRLEALRAATTLKKEEDDGGTSTSQARDSNEKETIRETTTERNRSRATSTKRNAAKGTDPGKKRGRKKKDDDDKDAAVSSTTTPKMRGRKRKQSAPVAEEKEERKDDDDHDDDENRKPRRRSEGGGGGKGRPKRQAAEEAEAAHPVATAITQEEKGTDDDSREAEESSVSCLPRTREKQLLSSPEGDDDDAENDDGRRHPKVRYVMGVDEAGRGPLAGPVVAAAAVVPVDIDGIADSKSVTKETAREALYEEIVRSGTSRWAVAVVDASKIDEINILQATLLAMKMASDAVIRSDPPNCVDVPSTSVTGCYVSIDKNRPSATATDPSTGTSKNNNDKGNLDANSVYALVDGNKVPKNMPCRAECVIRGDSKEYCIAAASILAKVTRDRLMHSYHDAYPEYNLARHKGYPTSAHVAAVREHGATPIHRRTFAPLKHMDFDDDGNIVVPAAADDEDED